MNILRKKIYENWFFIFPVLFAIYPVIFLYSNNVEDLLFSQLYVPVVMAFAGTILCWALLSILTKDPLKAGLITTLFIFIFFSYGILIDWLVSLNLFAIKHRYILPIVLFIAAYSGYSVSLIKNRELMINVGKILTVAVTILLLINLLNVIPLEFKKIQYTNQKNIYIGNQFVGNQSDEFPDIYYIILDEYASSDTIQEIWGYDNSEFENHLKSEGFYIARNSTVRYPITELSLDASLNMEYPGPKISPQEFNTVILNDQIESYLGYPMIDEYKKIRENKVVSYLKSKNYTIIVLDGLYSAKPAVGLMNADFHYNYILEKKVPLIDDFSFMILDNSILKPFIFLFEMDNVISSNDMSRYSTQYILSKIVNIPQIKGPKFVFVHLMIPHTPFIFDQNGYRVNPDNKVNWRDKQYYLNQYIYTNNKISSVVDEILSKSDVPPIIILQSDHGPRPFIAAKEDQTLDIPVIDMNKIFNAYYLPDGGNVSVYQNISPVNSFRVIFNHYFNENFSRMEDA
jgi:hypothetical protein